MESGDENGLRPDTPITTDNSQENCVIRQNLENIIRKYSNLASDLALLIKYWKTDITYSLDHPFYTELCERYIQHSNYRTEMEVTGETSPRH
ncbi:hypothetical protein NPIL_398831 [Nephila pilipes]|uniref:Uncharacterized protein n=1 Tax=Nephila pilipes TaxID=299642 RepID=A0A8X6R897_NEPPI|nr:hypothetical protein NPIL_398831 [Nephila pilipes]